MSNAACALATFGRRHNEVLARLHRFEAAQASIEAAVACFERPEEQDVARQLLFLVRHLAAETSPGDASLWELETQDVFRLVDEKYRRAIRDGP